MGIGMWLKVAVHRQTGRARILLFAVLRSITLAFVIALALLPLALLAAGWPWPAIASVVALAVIVIYAHRANVRARLQRRAGSPAS